MNEWLSGWNTNISLHSFFCSFFFSSLIHTDIFNMLLDNFYLKMRFSGRWQLRLSIISKHCSSLTLYFYLSIFSLIPSTTNKFIQYLMSLLFINFYCIFSFPSLFLFNTAKMTHYLISLLFFHRFSLSSHSFPYYFYSSTTRFNPTDQVAKRTGHSVTKINSK